MTAAAVDHDGPGWWNPPRRKRRLLDCLPTTLLALVTVAVLVAAGVRRR